MSLYRYFVLLPLVFMVSCFQEKEAFIPDTNIDDPAYLFSQSLEKIKKFDIPITENTTYFTSDNVNYLKIPAGCLIDNEGNVFTGQATIEIFTMQSLGDLIAFGKIPFTLSGPVASQNLFYLNIKAGGKNLSINPTLPIEWYSSTETSSNPYHLYFETITENNKKIWISQFSSNYLPWTVKINENQITGYGCVFPITQEGWFVIGSPVTPSSAQILFPCIESPPNFNKNNSIGFIIDKAGNTVIPLLHNETSMAFCNDLLGVTENSGIKFVLLSYQDDGQYHFGQLSTQVQKDQTYRINTKITPLSDILSALRAL
ncbi:MAG: hypothetical protein IPN79_05435 [Saprospiraceae bacterium]|nr:hypothetical protein [Saprospiraceae bacterium]